MNDLGVYLLVSVRRPYSSLLLDGDKVLEVRKQRLGTPYPALVYESGDGGAHKVLGIAMMGPGVLVCPEILPAVLKGAKLTREEYERYAGGRRTWAHAVYLARRFGTALTLETLGVERAPQSWMYVPVESTIIRGAMRYV